MLKCRVEVKLPGGEQVVEPASSQIAWGLEMALEEAREKRFKYALEGTEVAVVDSQDGAPLLAWRRERVDVVGLTWKPIL